MVLLDNIAFELQKAGGVSLVWRAVLDACQNDSSLNYKYLDSMKGKSNIFYPKKLKNTSIINDCDSRFLRRYRDVVVEEDIELFHSSYFRIHANKKVKNIVTIHDFVYEKFDSGIRKYVHLWQKKRALKAATAVICVSENTKQDLLSYHPWLDENKVRVIHNGVSSDFFPLEPSKKYSLPCKSPYLLYVGGRNSHKNFNASLVLLTTKLAKELGLKLVVIGGGGLSESELGQIESLQLSESVIHISNVDNSRLNGLYNFAYAFIYPSLYEGFGIPPIEAMAAGCPVICSNVSSIPEVVGNAGLMFDPVSPLDAEKYLLNLSDSEYRKSVITKGVQRASLFSWEKTGQKTVDLYKEVLKC